MTEGIPPALRDVVERHEGGRPRGTIDVLAGVLRDALVGGVFEPGSRLAESPLAELLGVSRNTLREVLRVLEVERLVVREPFRGVFVRRLGPADVADVYAVRRLIEVSAVRAAADADPAAVAALRSVVDSARAALAAGDVTALGTSDLRFHAALTALSGSDRLAEFMNRVNAELRLAFGAVDDPLAFHRPYVDRNDALCTLIERGRFDEAADELDRYLREAEVDLHTRM